VQKQLMEASEEVGKHVRQQLQELPSSEIAAAVRMAIHRFMEEFARSMDEFAHHFPDVQSRDFDMFSRHLADRIANTLHERYGYPYR